MHKMTKLYALLGVFLVICVAAFAVSRYQEQKENIKNSGEVILEIPTDSVTALSWVNESGTFSFSKGESWVYDDDSGFPVSEEKINDILSQFESLAASFVIEDVEDYAQYGLDEPICTISISVSEENYLLKLGNFSKMDEQRYLSIGDGKAYLVAHDPLDEFDAVLKDFILDDTIPNFDTAKEIVFTGSENYTVTQDEEINSICSSDIFFSDGKPLDTDNVESFLRLVRSLSLGNYVTYNATDEDLAAYGMDTPELTIQLTYPKEDDAADSESDGVLLLSLSRNPEEVAAYEEAVESDAAPLPAVTCYARVGQSQIIYEISESVYNNLTAVSYDTLRHQTLFTADFDSITSIDITLDNENYTFAYILSEDEADETGIWTYREATFDISDFKTALCSVSATEFTEETSGDSEEISLTVHLDNEDFPTFTLTLYRYDGTNCIAAVDGETVALVSRTQTVELMEAVNTVILGK